MPVLTLSVKRGGCRCKQNGPAMIAGPL